MTVSRRVKPLLIPASNAQFPPRNMTAVRIDKSQMNLCASQRFLSTSVEEIVGQKSNKSSIKYSNGLDTNPTFGEQRKSGMEVGRKFDPIQT